MSFTGDIVLMTKMILERVCNAKIKWNKRKDKNSKSEPA